MAKATGKTRGRPVAADAGAAEGWSQRRLRAGVPAPRSPESWLDSSTFGAGQPSRTAGKATGTGPRRAKVVVREAGPDDRASLRVLRRQAERTHARLMPDYFREAPPDAPGVWEPGQGPWSGVLVAVPAAPGRGGSAAAGDGAGALLGFVALKVVVTPRDPAMVPRRRAHVEVIVVDEGQRGTGVGTALMRAAAAWARERDATEMVLTVWADNAAADALYRSLGYQPIARVLRRKL